METELLSPLRSIAPGETTTFTITWGVCRCPGPIIHANDTGCTAEQLKAAVSEGYVRLTGQFGVFDRGELELVWRSNGAEVVDRLQLGAVDPLTAVLIDRVLPLPARAVRVELRVTPNVDHKHNLLAAADL
jgi:hypothetical protein